MLRLRSFEGEAKNFPLLYIKMEKIEMSPENFCYWLQGFFEVTGEVKELSPEQIKMIKEHLGYVFNKPANPSITYIPQVQPLPFVTTPPLDGTPWPGVGVEPLTVKC